MRKIFGVMLFLLVACNEETVPKPKAYLDLSFEKANYATLSLKRPYQFKVSKSAVVKDESNNWLKIQYPKLKASIDITYRPVTNNLVELIQESERLVLKHTVKAETISNQNFVNPERRVFGTLNEISGNAASQIQFHLTDSTKHFIKGALYFKSKPNYDSVLPAVAHIKKDVLELIETLQWDD